MGQERSELLRCVISTLPETQKRRFILYYEYDFNYIEGFYNRFCPHSFNNMLFPDQKELFFFQNFS